MIPALPAAVDVPVEEIVEEAFNKYEPMTNFGFEKPVGYKFVSSHGHGGGHGGGEGKTK